MNRLVKNGNDRHDIIDETGGLVAYVEKNRFGTHGHYRGYNHYCFCPELGRIIWAGETARLVYNRPDANAGETWTDAPSLFFNLKEVREFYGIAEEGKA